MTREFSPTTASFSVERIRSEMYKGVALPEGFLQKAIDKLNEKLTAKETKFFTHHGEVQQKVDVEDHGTQLAAADKILSIAGVYAREREAAPVHPTVTLEMDSTTGIVRLVVGVFISTSEDNNGHSTTLLSTDSKVAPQELEEPLRTAPPFALPVNVEQLPPSEEEPQVVRVRRGNLPIDVYNKLFGEA